MRIINILFALQFFVIAVKAQTNNHLVANPTDYNAIAIAEKYALPIDKVSVKGSYPLGVSEQKTIHIVFPGKIEDVDAGNDDITVQISDKFDNVLRVKSTCIGESCKETNLTVLTADGGLYSFITRYNKDPEILNINITNNKNADVVNSNNLGINYFLKSNYLLSQINTSEEDIKTYSIEAITKKAFIKNVGIQNLDISALLKGVYAKGQLMYYALEINNKSGLDYNIDFIKVYIKDKEKLKRMAVQEEEQKVLSVYPADKKLLSENTYNFCIATPFTTISDEKQIEIEVYEKDGGRHLRFPIDAKIIAKAKNL